MILRISDDLLWSQIVAKAWCDPALMKRLLSDPREILADHGMHLPENRRVQVVEGDEVEMFEGADRVLTFTLPFNPPDELTDEDLVGGAVAQCFSGACAACAACGRCGCRCSCRCNCACRCF
jgi:hypothetical protein